jgi:REP element-mobilizing transposase RayT
MVEGGQYNVYNRVSVGEHIFADAEEAIEFVEVLREVRDLDGWAILAWCLMGNHYHLVVKTRNVDLRNSVTRWLNRGPCDERDDPSFSERIYRLDAEISSK